MIESRILREEIVQCSTETLTFKCVRGEPYCWGQSVSSTHPKPRMASTHTSSTIPCYDERSAAEFSKPSVNRPSKRTGRVGVCAVRCARFIKRGRFRLSGDTPGHREGLTFRRVSAAALKRRMAHAESDSLVNSAASSSCGSPLSLAFSRAPFWPASQPWMPLSRAARAAWAGHGTGSRRWQNGS